MLAWIALAATAPSTLELTVDGTKREALVYGERSDKAAPLIFAFHGHGGNDRYSARKFDLHSLWPEAVVIYPQGLPTKTGRDPEGAKNGWQMTGTPEANRDVKFFDAMFVWAKANRNIDLHRVYVMGHSNGGGFTFALLRDRPKLFAAAAPAAATAGLFVNRIPKVSTLMISGERDEIVPFANQSRTADRLRTSFGLDGVTPKTDGKLRTWSGTDGLEFGWYVYDGPHAYPSDANAVVIDFFKRHSR